MSSLVGLGLLLQGSACVLLVREPQFYAEDVVEVVETASQKEALTACYEEYLGLRSAAVEAEQREANGLYVDVAPAVGAELESEHGVVVLAFTVEAGSGQFVRVEVDSARTTAPAQIAACVAGAVQGLEMEEPDQYDGKVTLAWEFRVGKPRTAPETPASGASLTGL